MAFPKAPVKPVRGTLRLVVRDPDTKVEVSSSEEDEIKKTPDYSEEMDIRLPKGFNVFRSVEELNKAQISNAYEAVRRIKERVDSCSLCSGDAFYAPLRSAPVVLDAISNVMESYTDVGISLAVSHNKNGPILIVLFVNAEQIRFYLGELSFSINGSQFRLEEFFRVEIAVNALLKKVSYR